MTPEVSNELQRVLNEALQYVTNEQGSYITSAHVFEALLADKDTQAMRLFNKINFDVQQAHEQLMELLPNEVATTAQIMPTKQLENVLKTAKQQAIENKASEVNTLHLLLAFFIEPISIPVKVLTEQRARLEWIQLLIQALHLNLENWVKRHPNVVTPKQTRPIQKEGTEWQFNEERFPTLAPVGRNLTLMAKQGRLDPVIGRDDEIDRALQILGRRTKNNPMLLGEPGVGKTAVAEGVALRIAAGTVPNDFVNKQLVQLDISGVVAGTKFRGEFEEKMKKIIDEVRRDGNIILFVDEMHMLMNAGGSEGAVDASNILKPALARGEIQMMGATTFDEYQKHIEKDRAFERRFAPIKIEEPSVSDTLLILEGLKSRYEDYHHVTIEDEAMEAAVTLSNRYLNDRQLPDKAIDLLDEAAAKLKLNHHQNQRVMTLRQEIKALEDEKINFMKEKDFIHAGDAQQLQAKKEDELQKALRRKGTKKVVTKAQIEEVLSQWTGIPVKQMAQKESARLLHLEDDLHRRVIGQDKACSAIARAIRRARSGLRDPKRPMGSFMFLGPTGVGKTELAKTLAETMFGSEDAMIRVDMSEFMSQENVSRLIGSAPGYVGYDEGGQLTEKVRHQPYSVVLFDEVEKAHPEVFNIMLQILDDGYVTDAKGRKVDFRNTIIIMTSNLGATELRDNKQVGFGADSEYDEEQLTATMMEALRQHFRPEFLNRIDETIVFHSLSEKDMVKIAKLMVKSLENRMKEQNITLKVTPSALEWLAQKGYDKENGARPLQRTIQTEVEDLLAEQLLAGEIVSGDTARIGIKQGKLYLTKTNK